ncbi:ABC transporter substrate-binding protein [Streptomyces cellulosae]|uniref:ABC transporter substrate-binding protein n=1 Tax=Streptomyces cellulosae TaxID=1968 RepID=UPI0004C7455A|nr:extracellular solute-binding protein [Streptomyces cellulosae]
MRSDPRRRGALLILLSITTLLVSACGGGSDNNAESKVVPASAGLDQLVAAAKKEGQITVYSAQDLTSLNNLAKAFETKYPGIDVKTVRGVDGDLGVKVETEFNTGKHIADMYVSASLSWVKPQAEAGRFLAPTGPELTGKGDYDTKQYVHEGNYFETNSAVLTFGWNTKLHPQGLTDYPDLLDPSLAGGKIGVVEPTAPSLVDFYLWLEETYGADYVKKLAAQKPRIYPSSLPMGEALQSGEIAAGSFIAPIALDPAKKKGAPVDYRMPPEGAWGARYYGMVLKGAPHPNAGQLFANFMVTAEGQKLITPSAGSVLPDVPGTVITNDKVRIQDPAKLTPDAVTAYQKKWKSLFQ